MGLLNIVFGWCWMVTGVIMGMLMGLRFESREWAGGYVSFERQCLRLAHISAFALSMLNVLYGMSLPSARLSPAWIHAGSLSMIAGAILMPMVCAGTALRNPVKRFFPLPALAVGAALVIMATGQMRTFLMR